MAAYTAAKIEEIVRAMKPEKQATALIRPGDQLRRSVLSIHAHDRRPRSWVSNPSNSVVNRYSQSWTCRTCFVYGASAFPPELRRRPDGAACRLGVFLSREDPGHLPQISGSAGADVRSKRLVAVVGSALTVLIAAIAVSYVSDHRAGEKSLTAPAPTAAVIARGGYLPGSATVPHATACPARPAFSGGLRMRTPIGAIYRPTNHVPIFPSPWHRAASRYADFDRALRFGVSAGHTHVPSDAYTSTYSTRRRMSVCAVWPTSSMQWPAASVPNRRPISCSPFPCVAAYVLAGGCSRPSPRRSSPCRE